MNKFNFNKLTPFKWFLLENFPFIEADFDALTEWQLFCKLGKEMNKIINSENTLGTQMENVTNAFIELQNYVNYYFDNLDVQDEINNKLNQMVADGTLPEIVASYLNSKAIFGFDNVESMKNATNLINGSYAKTLGYYEINDGGEATYKITNTVSETEYKEELKNGLFATLIIDNDSVNVHQFGAKGDGTTDDSNAINLALSSKAYNISFIKGNTYMVRGYEEGQPEGSTTGLIGTTGLIIPSNKNVDLNESTIKCITNSRQNYNIFTIAEKENIILKNGLIIGDRATHTGATGEWGYGVAIKSSTNITLDNLKISECWGDGINLNNNGNGSILNKNITINNCICDSNRRQGMSIENGDIINVINSQFNNTGNNNLHTAPSAGCDVEPGSYQNVKNVLFDNCSFNSNYGAGLLLDGTNVSLITVNNCKLINNKQNGSNSSLAILDSKDIKVLNCIGEREVVETSHSFSVPVYAQGNVTFRGNSFKNMFLSMKNNNLSNSTIVFENNYFYRNKDLPYNSTIETVQSTNTTGNNTLIIKNNEFINEPSVNSTILTFRVGSSFKKIFIENNLFKYSTRAIAVATNSIIKNNNIVATSNFSIFLMKNDEEPNYITTLEDNIFEETSYNSNNAGIINNTNNKNIIMRNNINYKNCLSSLDQQTRTYSPSRWLQNLNPTGVTLDENNNIIDNTFE